MDFSFSQEQDMLRESVSRYLEKNYEGFASLGWQDLVKHGLKALKASSQETELTEHNVSVGVVG